MGLEIEIMKSYLTFAEWSDVVPDIQNHFVTPFAFAYFHPTPPKPLKLGEDALAGVTST